MTPKTAQKSGLPTPTVAVFDMGGVLLEMGNLAGLPQGKLDFRGREAMAQAIREAGGKVTVGDLEEVFFAPWRREYARRYDTGHEARFEPHLRRLRKATGASLRGSQLLGAWFGPYGETLTPATGAVEALRGLGEAGVRMAVVSNVPLPGGPGGGPDKTTIYVQMPDTLALNVNSRVRVADVYVGRVREIALKNWVATLTLDLQPGIGASEPTAWPSRPARPEARLRDRRQMPRALAAAATWASSGSPTRSTNARKLSPARRALR